MMKHEPAERHCDAEDWTQILAWNVFRAKSVLAKS